MDYVTLVTQMAIVGMNFLTGKSYETKKIQRSRTNTSKNNKSHVDHDVTFSFKVTREGHAIDNSLNEFRDLITLRNKKKFNAVGQIQAEITKVT